MQYLVETVGEALQDYLNDRAKEGWTLVAMTRNAQDLNEVVMSRDGKPDEMTRIAPDRKG